MTSTLQNAARETDRNSSAGFSQFPLLYCCTRFFLNQPLERQTETPALDLASFLYFTCCTRFSSSSHTLALRLNLHASGRERPRARLHSRSISWRQLARDACGHSGLNSSAGFSQFAVLSSCSTSHTLTLRGVR